MLHQDHTSFLLGPTSQPGSEAVDVWVRGRSLPSQSSHNCQGLRDNRADGVLGSPAPSELLSLHFQFPRDLGSLDLDAKMPNVVTFCEPSTPDPWIPGLGGGHSVSSNQATGGGDTLPDGRQLEKRGRLVRAPRPPRGNLPEEGQAGAGHGVTVTASTLTADLRP